MGISHPTSTSKVVPGFALCMVMSDTECLQVGILVEGTFGCMNGLVSGNLRALMVYHL